MSYRKKIPKKITPTYLHNAGLYYLERFSASKAHFKDVMMRKVKRSCSYHKDQDYDSCVRMVDDLADKFETCHLLNDKTYAHSIASTMRRKGLSQQAIKIKMRNKGLSSDIIMDTITELDLRAHETEEQAEICAALTFARKKKIGPYFIGTDQNKQKSLGIFARAGFCYDVAKYILELKTEDLDSFPL